MAGKKIPKRQIGLNKVPSTKLMNYNSALSNANELYGTDEKNVHNRGFRSGILVTVLIPPVLTAHKYPSLASAPLIGNPVSSSNYTGKLQDQVKWYELAHKKINIKNAKEIIRLEAQLRQEERKKPKDAKAIKKITEKLAFLKTSAAKNESSLLTKYSSRFDITDYITSLAWGTSNLAGNAAGSIELNIGLDNAGGIFNYLPVAAQITVWRKKNVANWSSLNSFDQRWYPYFSAYIVDKKRTAAGRNQTMDLVCHDRLFFFGDNLVKKTRYKKDTKHPKGWSPREITIAICKENNIPYDPAKIPKYVIPPNSVGYPNGLLWPRVMDVQDESHKIETYISAAWKYSYKLLSTKDKRNFSIHTRTGNLQVDVVSPPGKDLNSQKVLYALSDEAFLESADLTENISPDKFYTVLVAKGVVRKLVDSEKIKKAKKKKKKTKRFTLVPVKGTFYGDPSALEAFGRKPISQSFKQKFHTEQEFKTYAQAWIDRKARPELTLNIGSIRGILGIWPIRYIYISSRYFGIRGNFRVDTVNYTMENGSLTMSLVLALNQQAFVDGQKYYSNYKSTEEDKKGMWY